MTKQNYIGAFLDGYFSAKKKMDYGFAYFAALEKATKIAEQKWKEYKNQKL